MRLYALPLEDRVVPAGPPALAAGSAAGARPEVRVPDTAGLPVRTLAAFADGFTAGCGRRLLT